MAEREAKAGKISDKDAAKIVADYKSELTKYPYLHLNGG
jgi:arginine decarboxylase-like protein